MVVVVVCFFELVVISEGCESKTDEKEKIGFWRRTMVLYSHSPRVSRRVIIFCHSSHVNTSKISLTGFVMCEGFQGLKTLCPYASSLPAANKAKDWV